MDLDSNWDDLRYFNALAQHHTLSETARRLDVSHTTVQRHVANAEHNLQVKLFIQSNSGYSLTTAGELLYRETSSMQRALKKIPHQIADENIELTGPVTLSVSDTFGYFSMPNIIEKIQYLHPKLQIHLVITNEHSNLQVFDVDIAVRISNHPPQELVGRQVGTVRFALCASQAYLKRHKLNSKNASKKARHFIALDQSFSKINFSQALPVPSNDAMVTTVNGFLTAYRLCVANLGVTLLPEYILDMENALVPLDTPVSLKTKLWVLSHAELRDNLRVRVVRQQLFENLRELL